MSKVWGADPKPRPARKKPPPKRASNPKVVKEAKIMSPSSKPRRQSGT